MKEIFRRYPIGIQNFEDLRNNNCVYIDKTALISQLTHTDKVYFLSRPRRFGKSLLIYTRSLFFRKERVVRRIGYGTVRERMDCLSCVAY